MKDKFLKIKDGNVLLVNVQGNLIRTYWRQGNCLRVDWYSEKDESVQCLLTNGQLKIINRNNGIIRTV